MNKSPAKYYSLNGATRQRLNRQTTFASTKNTKITNNHVDSDTNNYPTEIWLLLIIICFISLVREICG